VVDDEPLPEVPEGYTARQVPYGVTCPACNGSGRQGNQTCPECRGAKRLAAMRWEVVTIAQVREERRKRLRARAIALLVVIVFLVGVYALIHAAATGSCAPSPGLFDWPSGC
jgi:beta-lactamase regulating signal transducer with metallopeptidase domain